MPLDLDDFADLDAPEDEAKRQLDEGARRSVGPHDIDHPRVVGWALMPPEARAAACAAALFVGWPLETGLKGYRDQRGNELPARVVMRYDPKARVAFAIQPDPRTKDAPSKVTARAVPRTVEESLGPIRTAFGRHAEVAKFIKRRA